MKVEMGRMKIGNGIGMEIWNGMGHRIGNEVGIEIGNRRKSREWEEWKKKGMGWNKNRKMEWK